jgi:hypothetical protein
MKSFTKAFLFVCFLLSNVMAIVPGKLLNLTNWYLTLPIGEEEDPLDIYQKDGLNTYSVNPWFEVDSTKKYVLFRANCGGVTTSGSSHPRSELREMQNNGKDKANWSTSKGCHIMEITQKVTHLPAKKAIVVCGQIHGSSDDITVFRLEKNKLWATKGDESHGKLLSDEIALNKPFTIAFVAQKGSIEMYLDGERKFNYKKSATGCYFKAGAYVQSNVDKGDSANDYAEVGISALNVFHKVSGDTMYIPGKFFKNVTEIKAKNNLNIYNNSLSKANYQVNMLKKFTLNGAFVNCYKVKEVRAISTCILVLPEYNQKLVSIKK